MNLKQLWKFYEALQDDESRELFNIKYDILFEKKQSDFIETLIKMNYTWNLDRYDDCRFLIKNKRVIIFGAGVYGRITYDILKKNNISVYKFCDNNIEKQKTKVNDIEVIPFQDILSDPHNYFVIIASRKYAGSMLDQLTDSRFPRENIWYPRIGTLYATTGQQYFDCPNLPPIGKEEVFIDAGCFDMSTSKAFVKWSNGKYKRIIALEPDWYNYRNCLKNNDISNCELLPYAAWNSREILNSGSGSRVAEFSESKVQAESIDNILGGNRATFIKMDVEGAEAMALEGAANTIKNYKPRLAICIYHKPNDIYKIPLQLLSYRDDYKFYIRHYTSCNWETVLYAV